MLINVTLSKTELEEIVSKALFGEQKQISITIEEGTLEERSRCLPTLAQDGYGWFLMPEDYEKPCCPLEDLGQIEVQFRNGDTDADFPEAWGFSWVQQDSPFVITKFRPI